MGWQYEKERTDDDPEDEDEEEGDDEHEDDEEDDEEGNGEDYLQESREDSAEVPVPEWNAESHENAEVSETSRSGDSFTPSSSTTTHQPERSTTSSSTRTPATSSAAPKHNSTYSNLSLIVGLSVVAFLLFLAVVASITVFVCKWKIRNADCKVQKDAKKQKQEPDKSSLHSLEY